jgi:glycerol-3-phosphate acyltransferase PlsX
MGSDDFPVPDVAGAVLAARDYPDITVLLVGNQAQIRAELAKHDTQNLRLEIIDAAEVVSMEDKPTEIIDSKPNSSIHVGLRMLKDKSADAFVTAGNTGAALTIALLHAPRRIRGVKRPALCRDIRTKDMQAVLLDIGATPDAKPEWLAQFAMMGMIYARDILGIANPRVALLSNGEEETKGSQIVRETSALLQASSLNFTGNVEPKDVLRGAADVVVSDGFVGNIMIKTAEASMSMLEKMIKDEVKSSVVASIGGLLVRPSLRRVKRYLDPAEIGGALLLGIDGVVIIGHGRSNAVAIKNAIRQARAAVSSRIVHTIEVGLEHTTAPQM